MINSQTKDLFQLQTELVDMKVDMAVNKAIDRIVDQISDLKREMHNLRHDMNNQFLALDKRVFALEHRFGVVEERLGITNETKRQIKNKLIDYGFRMGWITLGALGSVMVYLIAELHILIK